MLSKNELALIYFTREIDDLEAAAYRLRERAYGDEDLNDYDVVNFTEEAEGLEFEALSLRSALERARLKAETEMNQPSDPPILF